MPTYQVDGNDLLAVYKIAKNAWTALVPAAARPSSRP